MEKEKEMIHQTKKDTSLVGRTQLDEYTIEELKHKTQIERDKLFGKDVVINICKDNLNVIFQGEMIQNLMSSKGLSPLTIEERNELIISIILRVHLKTNERQWIGKNTDVGKPKEFLARIDEVISTIFNDKDIRNLLSKIRKTLKPGVLPKNFGKIELGYIKEILYQLSKSNELWKITFSKLTLENLSDDEYIQMLRIKTKENHLIDDVKMVYKLNNYPLPKLEKPKDYTRADTAMDYILRNGLNQWKSNVNVLNTLAVNAFKVSPYVNERTFREIVKLKSMDDNQHLDYHAAEAKADKLSRNISSSVQFRLDFTQDEKLYFRWKFDSRGRIYPVSYQLHLQGSAYEKAMLLPHPDNFKGSVLDDTNKETIIEGVYIAIAHTLGEDKVSFEKRIDIGKRFYLANKNLSHLDFDYIVDTDGWEDYTFNEVTPMLRHYLDALNDTSKGIYPATMFYLDATNQALQLIAILTRSKKLGAMCNLDNGNERADAYQEFADILNKQFNTTIFNRTSCKYPLMITLYGSSKGLPALVDEIASNIIKEDRFEHFVNLLNIDAESIEKGFHEALLQFIPEVIKLKDITEEINTKLYKDSYVWTLPDGFKSRYLVKMKLEHKLELNKSKSKKIELVFNETIYAKNKMSRAMFANLIQSVDGYVAREMVRRMRGKFITPIHDAFACHPSDYKLMMENYEDILCDLLDSDLLNDMLNEITDNAVVATLPNELTKNNIRNSLYKLS